jgi:hypothetical protein
MLALGSCSPNSHPQDAYLGLKFHSAPSSVAWGTNLTLFHPFSKWT